MQNKPSFKIPTLKEIYKYAHKNADKVFFVTNASSCLICKMVKEIHNVNIYFSGHHGFRVDYIWDGPVYDIPLAYGDFTKWVYHNLTNQSLTGAEICTYMRKRLKKSESYFLS